jgi:hypothetical protein
MPPAENIALRVPRADEMPRLRGYLPLAFLPGGSPSWLIAERPATSEWLGAWCLSWTDPVGREAGFFLRIDHTALAVPMLERMLQAAVKAGIRRLSRVQMVAEDNPEWPFLQQRGFRVMHEVQAYEAPLTSIGQHIEPVYEALQRRGRLPDLEIQDFGPSNLTGVRELVLRHHLAPDFEFDHKCVSETMGYDRELSVVLADREGRVRGAFLVVVPAPGVGEIEVRVVDSSDPRTAFGANAMLLHEASRRGVKAGFEKCRFRSHSIDHRETANLAARIHATFLGRQFFVSKDL